MNKELIDLVNDIHAKTGRSLHDILSKSRKADIVVSRAVFCYVARFKMGYSCMDLGYILGIHNSCVSRLTTIRNRKYSGKIEKLAELVIMK